MTRRISAVVLKDSYEEIFRYELIICGVFLVLALDFRFGFLTGSRTGLLRAAGFPVALVLNPDTCRQQQW